VPWTSFAIDPVSPDGFQDQIAAYVRSAILRGVLKTGVAVPSTRVLARDLGVARQTVVLAYARLVAEGYLDSKPGSATRVSAVLPENLLHTARDGTRAARSARQAPAAPLSLRGAATARLPVTPARPGAGLLAPGIPALDEFPYRVWEQLAAEVWRGRPTGLLGYAEPGGHRPLRAAIAAYLAPVRGIACSPCQVVVTSGSQQAIALAAQMLADPGEVAWVEDPAYVAGRHALAAAGLRTVPVPVDGEGLDAAAGERLAPWARLVLVTPSHQYPLGAVMSLRRRLSLLDWARRACAWVIEDDYDSEFRYDGRPLQPLAALEPGSGRVVYVGTFSKVLAPGLRFGYLVLPPGLVDAFMAARALSDRQPPGPEQAVLAEFIHRGHLARHVRRMRGLYEARRDALSAAVMRHAGGLLAIVPPPCGLHVVGDLLQPNLSDVDAYRCALQRGLQTPPLSAYYANAPARSGLLLGFANSAEGVMDSSVRSLVAALEVASKCRG